MPTSLETIYNYVLMRPWLATSGQPKPEQFADIAGAGYSAVINLALPSSDHAVANEGSLVTEHGMSYHHIPVPFDAPDASHLRTFYGVMRALDGDKVWVHCVVNARVSAFVYHYLKHEKQSEETDARSPILERWEPQMDEVWKRFIELPTVADG